LKDKILSLGKIAAVIGVTRKTALRWVQKGMIRAHALPSGHFRVKAEDLVAFLQASAMPVPPSLLSQAPKKKVLLCDDDAAIRRVLRDLLKPHFLITEAGNGIEACIRIGADRPDLLILDIRMPQMDGLAVCRQVRSDPALSAMKIAILSAHIDREAKETLRGEADAILRKPFSPADLVQTCLSLTAGTPAPAPEPRPVGV